MSEVQAAPEAPKPNDAPLKRQEFTVEERRAQLIALASQTKGKNVIALLTVQMGTGQRNVIEQVYVCLEEKKKGVTGAGFRFLGPKVVKLNPGGITFSVHGRTYELDVEFTAFQNQLPVFMYDRDTCEPIKMVERRMMWNGKMMSVIQLLGHHSLSINKLIEQEILTNAANERPEPKVQKMNPVVLAAICIMCGLLGLFGGAFILR